MHRIFDRPRSFLVGIALAAGIAIAPGAEAQWYASGNAGATFAEDAFTPIQALGVVVNGEVDFDYGYAFLGAIGYKEQDFRFEGEISYRFQDAESYNATAVSGPGFGTITGAVSTPLSNTETSILAAMANVWYDVRMDSPFWRPYIGGGVGVAFSTLKIGTSDTGANEFDDSDAVFAYQVGVGIDYFLNPKTRIGLSYRYFGTLDPEYDDVVGGSAVKIDSQTSIHNLLFGITFSL